MAKNVIIFGSRVSELLGAPTNSDFLASAAELYGRGRLPERVAASFTNVFQALSQLQAVYSKSAFDSVGLESIFTAFDLARTLNRFPGRKPDEIATLNEDLKKLVIHTLEDRVRFRLENGVPVGAPGYKQFFRSLVDESNGRLASVAVLTLNYDVVLDQALATAGVPVDYGVGAPEGEDGLPFLKLHGSLNWAVTKQGGDIRPWFMKKFGKDLAACIRTDAGGAVIPVGSNIWQLSGYTNDAKQMEDLPLIVPQSWNRADGYRQISAVWARAAKELSEAEAIYVYGMTLSPMDGYFRQLYALSTANSRPLRRFRVYVKDDSEAPAFRAMIGKGTEPRFEVVPETYAKPLDQIASVINSERDLKPL